jgi:hypothetical protein
MPSTYTTNGGIELPANGEQSGTWGETVNDNMSIIDRLTNGVGSISLSGTTHTLTTTDGTLSDGQYNVLVLGGSPSGTNTITISPNDGEHVYIVKNISGQTATFTQGSGASISVLNNTTKIIYADGAGAGAAVVDITGALDLGSLIIAGTSVTATAAELNFVDGVTSNVQTQLNTKAPLASPTFTGTVTANGGAVFNESGADVDFRVESDTDANALFVEGSSGNVGIGTSSPNSKLTSQTASTSTSVFSFANQLNNSYGSNDSITALGFHNRADVNATGVGAAIALSGGGTSGGSGNLIFCIKPTTDIASVVAPSHEKMRIDSSGNVGIGTTAPTHKLTVGGYSNVDAANKLAIGDNADYQALIYMENANETLTIENTSDYAGRATIFKDNGTERMRIDSSGNLLVGTTSNYAENVQAAFYNASNGGISLASGTSGLSRLMFSDDVAGTAGVYVGSIIYSHADDSMRFNVNGGTERMRIDSSGNVLVGTTDTSPASNDVAGSLRSSTGLVQASVSGNPCLFVNRKTNDGDVVSIRRAGSQVGSISVTASATAYNTSSDYRLKTDAQPMTGASARVQALKPVNFEWISDGTRVDGFLAHEAQEVVPECVTGTKDAVGADGKPEYQGIDQSKLVPLLTAALQEALTKIADMEIRLSALEG